MTTIVRLATSVALLVVAVDSATAGSYLDIANCTLGDKDLPNAGCLLNDPAVQHPLCAPNCRITPFGVTHPVSYDGTQTSLQIRICVDASHPDLVPLVDAAIDMWEGLSPQIYNCRDCGTWEHPPQASGDPYAFVVMLHELGHCALALDHIDRDWLDSTGTVFEQGSFTMSAEAAKVPGAVDDGDDDIRGSADDYHEAPTGGQPADSISWFRISDNDPFIVDLTTAIDITTYSRSLSNLPATDSWGASANMCVFDPSLCVSSPPEHNSESQAVMYSGIGTQTLFFALGADDVNMLKMARTGVDWSANTADDYTVNLVNVGSCSNTHEIKVSMASLSVGTLGVCRENDIGYSFDPGNPLTARHFSVVFKSPGGPLVIELNSNETWDYATPIFASNFESGDTSAWDDTVP